MMRLTHGLAVLAVTALTMAAANAQAPTGNKQITFKGGIFSPAKGPVKDVSSNWWVGGVEYALGDPTARKVMSVEGLYTSKSSTIQNFGKEGVPSRYKMLSLMLNRRYRGVGDGQVALGNILFYGGGVGIDYIEAKVEDPNPGGEGSIDKKRTVPGVNLFIGYDMASNFQIEAKYQFVLDKVEGRDMSGLQFLIGLRF